MKGHRRHGPGGAAILHRDDGPCYRAHGSHQVRFLTAEAHRHAAAIGKAVNIDPRTIHGCNRGQIVEHVAEELHVIHVRIAPGFTRIPPLG